MKIHRKSGGKMKVSIIKSKVYSLSIDSKRLVDKMSDEL